MKRLLFSTISLVLFFTGSCTQAQVEVDRTTESRTVPAFQWVNFELAGKVLISVGQVYNLRIDGPSAALPLIETTVANGRLTIKGKKGSSVVRDKSVIVHLTMPNILGLSLSGPGYMQVLDAFKTSQLALDVSGSGLLLAKAIKATTMTVRLTGVARVQLSSGTSTVGKVVISGSSELDCPGYVWSSAYIEMTGSGKARLGTSDRLGVKLTGSGTVYYRGSPKVEANITGSGVVKPF